ncbi:MAG TPA: hypothetical protein PLG36_11670 [Trueperaceae bacterium]|nr:hypothetical protein [Trueperaceae bacterium]
MQPEAGASLTMPMAPEALRWHVAEFDSVGRARLEAYADREAVVRRLDQAYGAEGWSFTLAPLGAAALVGNLTLSGVTRADVVNAAGVNPESAAEVVLARCAALFGLRLPYATNDPSYWVDYDPEAQVPLYEPEPVGVAHLPEGLPSVGRPATGQTAQAATSGSAQGGIGVGAATAPPDDETLSADATQRLAGVAVVQNSGHEVIERLVERLKAAGQGREAARLVVRYNGYGSTAEESRELYGRLRALLKSGAEAT